MRFKSVIGIVFILRTNASAQCAMCRAVLESEQGQLAAKGINDGIMYLMVVPYVLVGVIGFFVYRTNKRKKHSNP